MIYAYTHTHTHTHTHTYINRHIYINRVPGTKFDHMSRILGNHLFKKHIVFLLFLPYLSRGDVFRRTRENIHIIIYVKVTVP